MNNNVIRTQELKNELLKYTQHAVSSPLEKLGLQMISFFDENDLIR